jgi:hypothetical protein
LLVCLGTPRAHPKTIIREKQMNTKRLVLAACAIVALSAGSAQAGPCDTTGRSANLKDAGSGPTPGNTGQTTTGTATNVDQHPPTGAMNRAAGDAPASAQDAQKQMQAQPTDAQQAEGAKPAEQTAGKDC